MIFALYARAFSREVLKTHLFAAKIKKTLEKDAPFRKFFLSLHSECQTNLIITYLLTFLKINAYEDFKITRSERTHLYGAER